jgi:hypothetical protein
LAEIKTVVAQVISVATLSPLSGLLNGTWLSSAGFESETPSAGVNEKGLGRSSETNSDSGARAAIAILASMSLWVGSVPDSAAKVFKGT